MCEYELYYLNSQARGWQAWTSLFLWCFCVAPCMYSMSKRKACTFGCLACALEDPRWDGVISGLVIFVVGIL